MKANLVNPGIHQNCPPSPPPHQRHQIINANGQVLCSETKISSFSPGSLHHWHADNCRLDRPRLWILPRGLLRLIYECFPGDSARSPKWLTDAMQCALCREERLSGTLQCRRLSGGSSGRPGLVNRHSLGRSMFFVCGVFCHGCCWYFLRCTLGVGWCCGVFVCVVVIDFFSFSLFFLLSF